MLLDLEKEALSDVIIDRGQRALFMHQQDQHTLWQFIRGDLPIQEFETWLYSSKDVELFAGKEFYLEVVSTDFKSTSEVYALKQKLEHFMRKKLPLSCECLALPNLAVTDMGSEQEELMWQTLELVKLYGPSRWWLALYRCKNCEQFWLIAEESRQNDIHFLRRLNQKEVEKIIQNNMWPTCFETLEELFALGKDSHRSVSFSDPLSPSLVFSVEDLIKARPNISVMEIASLLNLDLDGASRLYDHVKNSKKPWWKFWN